MRLSHHSGAGHKTLIVSSENREGEGQEWWLRASRLAASWSAAPARPERQQWHQAARIFSTQEPIARLAALAPLALDPPMP